MFHQSLRRFSSKPIQIPKGELNFVLTKFKIKKESIEEEGAMPYRARDQDKQIEQKAMNMVSIYQILTVMLMG